MPRAFRKNLWRSITQSWGRFIAIAAIVALGAGFFAGLRMTSPDIRAGVALLIAAMSAEGRSTIQNIDQIDRGYCNIDGRLNALGARITRCEECG